MAITLQAQLLGHAYRRTDVKSWCWFLILQSTLLGGPYPFPLTNSQLDMWVLPGRLAVVTPKRRSAETALPRQYQKSFNLHVASNECSRRRTSGNAGGMRETLVNPA